MAKFCHAIAPPCGANEPPPAEASSVLDTDFTPDTRRLLQLAVLLWYKLVQSCNKSHFVVPLDRYLTKNTGWFLIKEAVFLDK